LGSPLRRGLIGAERYAEPRYAEPRYLEPRYAEPRYGLGDPYRRELRPAYVVDDRRSAPLQGLVSNVRTIDGFGANVRTIEPRGTKPMVYGVGASQPCRAVQLFIALTGIQVDYKELDLAKQEHKNPEALAINPNGTVPAMSHDGFNLYESHAIMRYLAELNGQQSWLGDDVRSRALCAQYCDWHHTHTRKATFPYIFNTVFCYLFGAPSNGEQVQEGKKLYIQHMQFLNDHVLSRSKFIAGDRPTIADCSAYAEYSQLRSFPHDFTIPQNVARWFNDFEALNPEVFRTALVTGAWLGVVDMAKAKAR